MNIEKFRSNEEYINWIESVDWYQSIPLNNGVITSGKINETIRTDVISNIDFNGKRVLDLGCNSGKYSLLAKSLGAKEVVGVDPDIDRINQAKTLAVNEGLPIDFIVGTLDDILSWEPFDIVICVAVLTEVENILGGLRALSDLTVERTFIEMGLSKPKLYFSTNRQWWVRDRTVSRLDRIGEFRRHKHVGWVIYPSLDLVRDIFGSNRKVNHLGKGPRYDMLEVVSK